MSTEEKHEMEQVPLKSDTDAPAAETTDAPAATEAAPAPAKKPLFGGLFKKNPKKPAAETAEAAATTEGEAPAAEEKACKKKCWWSRGGKSETEQKEDQISIGINLVDRDERGLNEHVKLDFHDIFGEAETNHSFDCLWRLFFKVFTWFYSVVYKVLTLIVFFPAAILFAILFALVTVLNNFFCIPAGKLLLVPGAWLAKTWSWIIHAVADPVTSSLGLFFSSFTIRKYGINSQPTDPCVA